MNIVLAINPSAKLSKVNAVYEHLKHLKDVEDDVIESINLVEV